MNEHLAKAEITLQLENIKKRVAKIKEMLDDLSTKTDIKDLAASCSDQISMMGASLLPDAVDDDVEQNELDQEDFLDMVECINDARQVNGLKCYIPSGEDVLQELKEAVTGVPTASIEPILETFKPLGSEEIKRAASNITSTFPKKDTSGLTGIVMCGPATKQTGDSIRDVKTKAINDVMYLVRKFCPALDVIGDYTKYFSYASQPHIALAPILAFTARYFTAENAEGFLYYCYTRGLANPEFISVGATRDVDLNKAVELIIKFLEIYGNSIVTNEQDRAWEDVMELSQYLYDADLRAAEISINEFKNSYCKI